MGINMKRLLVAATPLIAALLWTDTYERTLATELSADTPVSVRGGRIKGAVSQLNGDIVTFKGIPYAAPPVGELRWKPPAQVAPWQGIRDAARYGPSCMQNGPRETQSEDCLLLNVWAPARTDAPRPVMVWIHGGGYSGGSGSGGIYDGTHLASQGAVLVTINYRLNVFGFLAHPSLSDESPRKASGNYGLLDAVAALEWVRDNIGVFGGDPARVTIFGESAGGGMVMSLMVVPQAKGLFHRAIAQSNYIHGWDRALEASARGWAAAEAQGVRIARALGATGTGPAALAVMRAASATDVLAAAAAGGSSLFTREGNVWAPNVDSWVVPDDPLIIYQTGRQHPVALIAGMNGNEGSMFSRNLGIADRGSFEGYVRKVYPGVADDMLAHYAVGSDADVGAAVEHLLHDVFFAGPVRFHVGSHAKAGSRAWLYHFTRVPPTPGGQRMGSHHAAELAYVFGNLAPRPASGSPTEAALETLVGGSYGEADRRLSDAIVRHWVQFATTGNPNRDGLPAWPQYDSVTDRYLEFGERITAGAGTHRRGGELWIKLEGALRAR
jgi:para-nitrobenzyl esterase